MSSFQRTIQNLSSGTRYAVRVRSFNNLGVASDWSEILDFTTLGDLIASNSPTGLTIDYTSPTLIVSWTPPTTNADGTPFHDFSYYEISLTANSITVVYSSSTPSFSYGINQNTLDFNGAQGTIQISVKSVDIYGNKSAALTGTATNGVPSNAIDPPELATAFTITTITMKSGQNTDWGGYYLEYSLNNATWIALATLINQDTYSQEVLPDTTYYYRYKIRDKFGNLSSGFSPVANIHTHRVLVIDGFTVVDNLYIKSSLVVGNPNDNDGQIQSFNYSTNSGYILTNDSATFQNGSITVIGASGVVTIDSTSLRAVYSGVTQLLVNSSGVFLGGNDANTAEIYVDPATQTTHIHGNTLFESAGGNYTFSIDLSNQTTGSKVLRLFDSFGNDTFYLTNDGFGFFAKGNINLGGSSALNMDNNGNIWLGHTNFASAPFSVSSVGALTATSATVTGTINATAGTFTNTVTVNGTLTVGGNIQSSTWNGSNVGWIISPSSVTFNGADILGSTITGSTITGGTIQTATSGQRVTISGGSVNEVVFNSTGTDYAPGVVYVTYNGGTTEATMFLASPQSTNVASYAQIYCIGRVGSGSTALMEANDIRLRGVGPSIANNLIVDANAILFEGDSSFPHDGFSKLQSYLGIGVDNSAIGYSGSVNSPANGAQTVDGPYLYGNQGVMLGGDPIEGGLLRVYGNGGTLRTDIFTDTFVFGDHTVSGAKSFEIDHPILGEDYFLRFSSLEGPRAELIYRGKIQLEDGIAIIDIDEYYAMESGTFDSLNMLDNRQVFLYNETGDCPVRYSLKKAILTITSKDKDGIVGWMVIGERGDKQMINQSSTNEHGRIKVQGKRTEFERETILAHVAPYGAR